MSNITTVGITSGVPTSGTGTVSTLDNLVGAAGTPSTNVQSIQGVSGGTAVKVDGSTVTQPVSAASLPLPTGAATSANQTAIAGNQTSVIGTKAAGTAAASSLLIGGVFNSAAPTLTTGQQAAAQFDSSGNLKVNVSAGGGSGGTSSTFGAAFPSTGTAIGGSDGTNMVTARIKTSAPTGADPAIVVALSPNGLNPNGQATMTNSAPFVLSTNQTTISVAQDTTQLASGASGTYLTPKYAVISASSSGANTIVTPTAGKKVRVLEWIVKVNAAVNFKWQTQTGPTDLTGLFYNGNQGDGAGGSYCPIGHFITSTASDTLILNLSGAVAVGGYLVYVEV